jgi:NAD(P)-dependent dehydrogenase (short-subunit alcohol dehydrogenase family)
VSDHAIFVTGAGSGIGRSVTARLLSAGDTVFAGVLSEQEAAGLGDLSGALTTVQLDVRNAESVQDAVAVIQTALDGRKLRAVLNIAGVTTNGPLVDLDPSTFANVLAVNVVGMHTVTRAALPLLAEGGRVVNVSSSSGSRTLPFTGAYSASKFAVEALSTAMRMEFAALQRRYELHNNYLRDVVLMRVLAVGIRESLIRKRLGLNPQKVAA